MDTTARNGIVQLPMPPVQPDHRRLDNLDFASTTETSSPMVNQINRSTEIQPTDRILSARGTAPRCTELGDTEMPRKTRSKDVVDCLMSQESLTPLCQVPERPHSSGRIKVTSPSSSHDSYTLLHLLSLASHVAIERRVAFGSRTGPWLHHLNGVGDKT